MPALWRAGHIELLQIRQWPCNPLAARGELDFPWAHTSSPAAGSDYCPISGGLWLTAEKPLSSMSSGGRRLDGSACAGWRGSWE